METLPRTLRIVLDAIGPFVTVYGIALTSADEAHVVGGLLLLVVLPIILLVNHARARDLRYHTSHRFVEIRGI